jgi:murein DD-endopeptidase MepM/ murein hydrolase activator NlpD
MEQGGATSVAEGIEEHVSEEAPTGGVDMGQDGATPTAHGVPDALVRPVEGHVTQPYSAQHPAVDIAAEARTPVLAAADGVVAAAHWSEEGYGNVVAIDHGDELRALYSHLLDYQVKTGDVVVTGQQIGSVGNTGKSTGPHLHFELRKFVNPLLLLESVDTGPGAFVWPVEGEITQGYSAQHHALDIAAEAGTPVLAATDGVVVAAQWDSEGYGNIVLIDHGGELRALYSHLLDYQVEVGDEVTAGQQIGTVGNTGQSTGPHLHFELRQHLDPLPLLQD